MRMTTLMIAAVVVVACSKPQPVESPPLNATLDTRTGGAVDALLNAFEDAHADAATWQRLGPAAATALRRVLADEAQGATRRGRAAEALGFVATPEDRALLRSIAAGSANHRNLRMSALSGLVASDRAGAVTVLAPFLDDPESGVRARAIDLLAELQTPDARRLLTQLAERPGPDQLRAMRAVR